jgi:hypothetical protein
VDLTRPVMAIGNSAKGMNMGLYSFRVEQEGLINRDFDQVKADGKIYCYDSFLPGQSAGGWPLGKSDGILLLSWPDTVTLMVEWIAGGGTAMVRVAFTANATTFKR